MDAEKLPQLPPTVADAESTDLRKPQEMVVLMPTSGRVTLLGRKLYNVMLRVSQARLMTMHELPAADYLFESPLNVLLRSTGSSGEDRTAAKRYLAEMQQLTVNWESTAPGDGVKWHAMNMLAECKLEQRNGENWVAWAYPPSIMQTLRDPVRWARLRLDVLSKISTYSALALYEVCARYRDNPSGVTNRKPPAWWQDALSPGPSTAKREWRKFKNERVKPAIEEINAETDLEVELIEHKQGRTVVEIQFSVRKKRMERKPFVEDAELVDPQLVMRAGSLGIREAKFELLLREFGEVAVRVQLDSLEKRVANRSLKTIDNAFAFLRTMLRNTTGEGREEVLEAAPAGVPPLVAAKPVLTPASQDAEEGKTKHAELRSQIESLSSEARKELGVLALSQLKTQGLANAALVRRAEQGDILYGILGATVLQLYEERLGRAERELSFGQGKAE